METKNKITGRIVRADNGRGIENLKVVVFDIDSATTKYIMGDASGMMSYNTPKEPDSRSSFNVLRAIFGSADEEDLDLRGLAPAGDRLGSVLTNDKGYFEIEFDDVEFNDSGKEKRPDILLTVIGPDTTQVIDGLAIGMFEILRLVHMAMFPSWNAGRQESFFIKVSEELFEKAGVKNDGVQALDIGNFFGNLASDEGQARRTQRAEIAKKIPNMLTPRALAKNPQFIPKTFSTSEADLMQRTVIKSGIETLSKITIPPAIVYLTDLEIVPFFPGGTTTSSVTVSACDLLDLKGLGVSYKRVRSLVTEARAKKQSADFRKSELPKCETKTPPAPPDIDLAMQTIKERVLGQIESLPAFNSPEKKTIIDDLKAIKARINELEMGSGPANVTAFRDFHNLQMAFKDVWTAAFDKELETDVQNLFDEINRIDDDYGNTFPRPDDLRDIRDFEDFILSISNDLGAFQELWVSVPPAYSDFFTDAEWNRLKPRLQMQFGTVFEQATVIYPDDTNAQYLHRNTYAVFLKETPTSLNGIGRMQQLISDIGDRLSRPYSFKYYAADSVNYGTLIKYRQEWKPLNYQVGRLVSTLPLAPGETRELKVTQKVKRTRAEKEMRKALSENSYESSSSIKSELDVIAKLATDTNFKMSASGSFTLGIGSIESASEFSHNQKTESNRQHKQISEVTRKAAEKVRQEREVSIESTQDFESNLESIQKIHNPNNEVTVTYLMYELERRYQVHQRLESVTPVIMLALDLPSPHELTEGWVLEHAWILRRALLDDAFEEAIHIIENGRASEAVDIEIKKAIYEREQATMSGISTEFDAIVKDRAALRSQIINFQKQADDYQAGKESTGDKVKDFFLSGGFSIFGGGDNEPNQGKLYESMIKAAESRLKHIDQQAEELATTQRAAKREAREAGQQYANALKAIAQKDTQIKQLLLHIRQNIFHYMHAIWEMKHPDQWFFEWAEKMVYHVGAGEVTCTLSRWKNLLPMPPGVERKGNPYEIHCDKPLPPDLDILSEEGKVPLGSIAHVDQLLGFKGNYAVFPLKDCTHITDYMMREFVDDYLGVRDPALDIGVTSAELIDYAKEVWEDETLSDEDRTTLSEILAKSLSSPVPDTQEIILPTGQIYMEALKGETTLLEDFKLAHRGLDVLKVQEEVRQGRLDNIRRAGLMVGPDVNFDDPDVDKYVKIIGGNETIVDTD
ncbi:hypothetical protein IWQ47_001540 [Aquimarina sp. EL_43]|uniref:hypothetical protein n=1 Tax=unclassified Aquimarina TaxID=2627091 RepID=UPI0018CB4CC9|nr:MULTISPECIES: hypothetical protein [unclassified Aquimarina]MBG6130377.1 hypothetical protein [Aquimarina sp. EL_35]MBG6149157.1 hypothetical protein [Aquimarina sp. EL_32]MBG6168469.1 hypothetical protein [Aquimarina sp. EL_43]